MSAQGKKLIDSRELVIIGASLALVVAHVALWERIKSEPSVSAMLFAVAALVFGAYWLWRNFSILDTRQDMPVVIKEKLEGILHTIFLPRGYDILRLPSVDKSDFCWAEIRDPHGVRVSVLYIHREEKEPVTEDELRLLDEVMNESDTPKGICLTTSYFRPNALDFGRQRNILTRDSAELVELLRRAEEEAAGSALAGEHRCRYCGSKLELSPDVKDLMLCPNKDCRREFTREEIEQEQKIRSGEITAFTVNCYECSRPVELDLEMSGLVECPYDDCSWIINVDNEILAIRGGLDKRASENLAEIVCPKCQKRIRVPADAGGLMECPCEEKWVIDVGAALAEREEAQVVDRPVEGEPGDSGEVECPGCGAGVPASLDECPVCGGTLEKPRNKENAGGPEAGEAEEEAVAVESRPLETRQVSHRHAYMSISTRGMMVFFALSIAAFLVFVYMITN